MKRSAKEKLKKQKLANLAKAQTLAKAEVKAKRAAEAEAIAKQKSLAARFFSKTELMGKNKKDEQETRQARHDFLERLLAVHGPLQPELQDCWSSFRHQMVDATFSKMNRSVAAELLLEAKAKIQRKIKERPHYLSHWVKHMQKKFLRKEQGAML